MFHYLQADDGSLGKVCVPSESCSFQLYTKSCSNSSSHTVGGPFRTGSLKFRGSDTNSTRLLGFTDSKDCIVLHFLLSHLSVDPIHDRGNCSWA